MKRKMIIRFASLGLIALLAASCFSLDDGSSKNDWYIQVRNEPDNPSDYESFMKTMFNDGKDTVSFNPRVSYGPIYHFGKLTDDGKFLGGFAFCIGKDTLTAPDRRPARFAVCDDGGNNGTLGYAVYHDTIPSLLPDHAVEVYIPNELSSCTPALVYVQNTHAVVEAVKYGVGLADGPFQAGDYLSVTFKSSRGGKAVGEKTFRLVDGPKLLDGWTEVDLSDLKSMDALDISLASNRPDMPLYVCLDDFVYRYIEIY